MSETTLYDRNGKSVAYVVEDGAIYTWRGHAQCYLDGDRVFGWNGRHLGWFVNGIVYDLRGRRVGYTREKSPRAVYASPAKYAKYARYAKYAKHAARARPGLSTGTSETDLADFLQAGRA